MEISKHEVTQSLKSLIYARKLLIDNEDERFMPRTEYADKQNSEYMPQSYSYYMTLTSIEEAISKLFWQVFEFPELESSDEMFNIRKRGVSGFVFLTGQKGEKIEYHREALRCCYDFLKAPDCDPKILLMFDYFASEVTWSYNIDDLEFQDIKFREQRDELYRQTKSWLVLMFYCYLSGLEPEEAACDMLQYHGHSLYVFESSTCAAEKWYKYRKEQKKKEEEENKKPSENR